MGWQPRELLALCRLMEAQFQDERKEILQAHDQRLQALDREEAELSARGVASEDRLEILKDARRSADEKRQKELDRLRCEVAITDNENEQIRDYADELIDEHDFRAASRIHLTCSSWRTVSRTCSIHISNGSYGHITLTISGDTPWVRAAFGALEKELRQGRPWWSIARNEAAYWVMTLGIAASATLALTGVVSITPLYDQLGDFRVIAIWLSFSLLLFAALPGTNWLISRLFPNFEILDPDAVTSRKKFSRSIGLAIGGFVVLVTVLQGLAWIVDRLRS